MTISSKESKLFLDAELEKEGFFVDSKNWEKAWRAFKKFSDFQVDCAMDGFLWQTGTSSTSGINEFYYDITRQFSHIDDEDGLVYMEQLHLRFYFEPNDILAHLEYHVWSFDFDNKDIFFNHVEGLECFKVPPAQFAPTRYEIIFFEI